MNVPQSAASLGYASDKHAVCCTVQQIEAAYPSLRRWPLLYISVGLLGTWCRGSSPGFMAPNIVGWASMYWPSTKSLQHHKAHHHEKVNVVCVHTNAGCGHQD